MIRRAATTAMLCATALSAADRANAAEPPSQARAAALFEQGRAQIDDGDLVGGCEKLVESQRIEAAPGTALNLAACLERQGRLATAWALWQTGERLARQAGRPEWARIGRARAESLAPRLPRIVVLPDRTEADDLAVTLDGEDLGKASWGAPLPVDPGLHTLQARAKGRVPWTATFDGEPGTTRRFTVPLLARVPAPPLVRDVPGTPLRAARLGTWLPIAGVTATSVGLVGLGIGAVTGALALEKESRVAATCPADACSDRGLVATSHDAAFLGQVSTVALVTGAVLVTTGVVLLLVAPRSASGARAAGLYPLRF